MQGCREMAPGVERPMRAFQKHENNPMHSSLQENSVSINGLLVVFRYLIGSDSPPRPSESRFPGRSGTVASVAAGKHRHRLARPPGQPRLLCPRRGALMNLDRVQRQMEFGGTLFAVLLAKLVFLALELAHLLPRRLQQWNAPDRIVMRVVRHD